VRGGADPIDRLVGAGGRLGVDDCDDFRFDAFDRRDHLILLERPAPGRLDLLDGRPAALGHVDHAPGEHAVDADEHLVAGLDEIDEHRLHPR
jgi:hypothetical protein